MEKMADFKPETDKCPVCDTTWTKTNFGAKTWYDCKPCGKTAEDIVVVKNKTKSGGTKEYKLDSLDEWEAFIDMMNIDDDDYGVPFMKVTKANKIAYLNYLMEAGAITTSEQYLKALDYIYSEGEIK